MPAGSSGGLSAAPVRKKRQDTAHRRRYTRTMRRRDIRWGAALGGMLLAEVAQIAAAFAWVALYSYLIHPGETPAFYQRYAELAGPWVSVLAGTPIFYLVCRWIGAGSGCVGSCRRGTRPCPRTAPGVERLSRSRQPR